jgi:hypothetical protein
MTANPPALPRVLVSLSAAILLHAGVAPAAHAQVRHATFEAGGRQEPVAPVLEFPESGLDDPASYEGYRTRFFRDVRGNAFQVYLSQRTGRVVNLWANAANESAGFTVRGAAGKPARLDWASEGAEVRGAGGAHSVEYRLRAGEPLEIGWFLLGTMRVERDFQYHEHGLKPFGAAPFPRPELDELIAMLERLDPAERRRHLALLNAGGVRELRERLQPSVRSAASDTAWIVRVEQPSFDGRNRMALELAVDRREAEVELRGRAVSVRPRSGRPIHLTVRATTDAAPLTPLGRAEIFNQDFLRFYERQRAEQGGSLAFRRLDRQVRSLEMLSYREKLMAGLPNFATYFGRDMLMTALMMEPVWSEAMSEHAIASVLRKLSPTGEVSHEEALGGQAIRENAPVYSALMDAYFRRRSRGEAAADSALARARIVLGELQAVRENYGNMMDDDFQFPVLVARYLADPDVPRQRKLAFLLAPARAGSHTSRLGLLLRNLAYVARMAEPYAGEPVVTNLVGFRKRTGDAWFPGSWRDSNAGYANGRFAMDINVVWVPQALEATGRILSALRELGFSAAVLERMAPELRGTPLGGYVHGPESLDRAVRTWQGTERHFVVKLGPEEARERVEAKLAWLPEEERSHWRQALGNPPGSIEFLALSLDAEGRPIPVVSTDPATHLYLEPRADRPDLVLRDARAILLPYPAGLFVPGLGPVVSNDTYASRPVWESFRADQYHSPRVVWGREVNLVILGLTRQIHAAHDPAGRLKDAGLAPYVRELHGALRRTVAAVEASGLKHNELWSYRIENSRLLPVRYGSTSDVQLWNLTDLAVQYELARLPPPPGG